MQVSRLSAHRLICGLIAVVVWMCFDARASFAQANCLQPGRLEAIKKELGSERTEPANEVLRLELLDAVSKINELSRSGNLSANQDPKNDSGAFFKTWTDRVCSILNAQGWPSRTAIGSEGSNAFVYIIQRALPTKLQIELYPLISAGYLSGEIKGSEALAGYVDRIRLALRRKQIYGTQAYVRDGFLVMAPIENVAEVDKRRSNFGLSPLRSYERSLELQYKMPLIRLVSEPPLSTSTTTSKANTSTNSDGLGDLGDETPIVVETAFVSVDVIIPDAAESGAGSLEKSDFQLFDNGKKVEIETFAKAGAPFDIVLLLDLSGSTADKVGLIKKTTRRFVEMKRPIDRVAVVTFHDKQTVVSELESDKAVLLDRIKDIGGRGGSRVWDSIKFALDMLNETSEGGRRKAIVLMSDGADNQLTFYPTLTQRMSFADLVEAVQRSTAAIFPIYLDTEDGRLGSRRVYADARRTLAYLADQSAGNMYMAKKIDDLSDIYDRVLKDVGTVYTLGFTPDIEPDNSNSWRTLRVEVPSKPDLKLKHRPGYFVK